MSHVSYVMYLTVVALTVVANGGNGSRKHFAIQLYLILLILLCTLSATGSLHA